MEDWTSSVNVKKSNALDVAILLQTYYIFLIFNFTGYRGRF
jgi:hypothetical protein